jgi:MFS family permease
MDFLLAKRPADALQRLNSLLRRMQREAVAQLPEAPPVEEKHRQGNPVAHLFIGGLARSTLLIWSSFFLLMFAFYFVLSWTPKLLVQAGLSSQQGITGGVLMNLGGIIGGTLFGLMSSKISLRNLTGAYLVLTAVGLVLFGMFATNLGMAFAVALFIGFFIFGSMAGLYSLAPILYPAVIRTTGMGWSIGIGRIGAIIAPTFVGFLLDSGWQAAQLYYGFTIPLILAMITVQALRLKPQ